MKKLAIAVMMGAFAAWADLVVSPLAFESNGWALDSQFMDVMGSPYLLAHGLGIPVGDAVAEVEFPSAGKYHVWVRERNWCEGAPGKFKVAVNGVRLDPVFGTTHENWDWTYGGEVSVGQGRGEVRLVDLTGFEGRCAGVVFTRDKVKPDGAIKLTDRPADEKFDFEFVIVGGGQTGTAAALAAARSGVKTALVQDRPVLGGNASSEIRVWSGGEIRYPIVNETRNRFMNRNPNAEICDRQRLALANREPMLTVFLSTRAFDVVKSGEEIKSVKAIDLKRNRIIEFSAPLFADTTGDGWIGYWAKADWRMGREARAEYNEPSAPVKADDHTLGASLMWYSEEANTTIPFSAPWAEKFSQGVVATAGEWNWEYGIRNDIIVEGEEVRDRILKAIFGAFSLAKKNPDNGRKVLVFCPFILGKRESRRLLGDYVFSERDVTEHRFFEDAVATGSWSIDLHYDNYKKGVDFLTTCVQPHYGRYYMPFRSLYSRNVPNLMMAGRCFSCTHVGLGSPRVMNSLAQQGVAVGYAASLCKKYSMKPRELYKNGKMRELQDLLGGDWQDRPDPRMAKWIIVDDEDKSVVFKGQWNARHHHNGGQVGHKVHYPKDASCLAVYPVPVKSKGKYELYRRNPFYPQRSCTTKSTYRVVSGDKNQKVEIFWSGEPDSWQKIGVFELQPGAKVEVVGGYADGIAAVPCK